MIKMGFEQLRKQNTLQGKEEPRQQAWDGIGYGKWMKFAAGNYEFVVALVYKVER